MNLDENDVIPIGKLRRAGRPAAAISYDPGHGIRVQGEDAPADAVGAALWCRRQRGWLRVYNAARRSKSVVIRDFIKTWRAHGPTHGHS